MSKTFVVLATLVTLGGGLLLWQHNKPSVLAAPVPTQRPTPLAPRTPRALPARHDVDLQAVETYKRSRFPFPASIDKWVRRAQVTPEQVAQTLQLLADAQVIYDETKELREELRIAAYDMRDARMPLEQRLRLNVTRRRQVDIETQLRLAGKPLDSEELMAAVKEDADLADHIYEALEATAPPAERAAFAAAEQVTNDLETQVRAGLADFLTPRQIEIFEGWVGSVPNLLEASYPVDYRPDDFIVTVTENK